jgi:SPX domain
VNDAPPSAAEEAEAPPSLPLTGTAVGQHQSNGDETSERRQAVGQQSEDASTAGASSTSGAEEQSARRPSDTSGNDVIANQLGSSPAEIAFFKLLHTEVKKASHFFEQAQKEYAIREDRVRKGMELITNERGEKPTGDAYYDKSFEEQWARLAQSIFRLYRELLLLETFAIMNYCGFSKILKKHDKNTGFSTRNAFMAKVVNQANFTHYPSVLQMINRCERLYEEASNRMIQDGKQSLHEDERLFIHMIHRLNAQVVGVDDGRKQAASPSPPSIQGKKKNPITTADASAPIATRQQAFELSYTPFEKASWKAQSLQELVAENDAMLNDEAKQEEDSDSDGEGDTKPKATAAKKASPDCVQSLKRKSSEDDTHQEDDTKLPDNESKRPKEC